MNDNIHGLSRHIPAEIKREIRRRSKHGCVFCRGMIYQYEHIEPQFASALTHDPDTICLLCPTCHSEVTAGRLSKREVADAYVRIQQTDAVQPPHYQMRISGQMRLGLGASTFDFLTDAFSILDYDGESILGVQYKSDPVLGGIYPAISGIVCNRHGQPMLGIIDNELTLKSGNADVEAVGPLIRIRDVAADFDLQLTFEPPGGLRIDRLLMRFKEIEIDTRNDFGVTGPTLNNRRARCLVGRIEASGCAAAIAYRSDRSSWHTNGISMTGGVGIELPFMGIIIAKGAGAMTPPKLELEWG